MATKLQFRFNLRNFISLSNEMQDNKVPFIFPIAIVLGNVDYWAFFYIHNIKKMI